MLRRLALAAVIVSLLGSLAAPLASAVEPPVPLEYACAAKSNGLMRAATSPSQCNPKKETVVSFTVAAPVTICLKPDGSVRLGQCMGTGTTITVPSNTPRYFCADMASTAKTLIWISDPANCPPGTTAFVVVNHAPTDIALSNSSVAENEPVGTTVGTLSATDPDAGDTFTFTLVSGAGDADNASFQITGSTLKTNAVFDYETKSSYSIRVRVTDNLGLTYEEAFTITVTDVVENAAPTDIQLSNSTVAENQPGGTNVGTLTTTDPDAGDTHTYSLVAGTGDEDNAKFQISGSTLQTAVPLDFEDDSSLSVRVRTFDGSSGYEESFTITVTDANDAPTDIALSNSSVAENQPAGTTVGTLSATDPDAGATHTFSLVVGLGDEDNAKFQISGSTLQTAQSLDFEAGSSLTVRVRADDGAGGTFEKSLTITVTNANDAPTDITLSNSSVAEDEPVGTTVGTLSATDQDAGDTQTFALVAGAGGEDNASFQIDGSTLETNAVFDFETKSSYSIRVQVTDAGSLTFEEQFTITITNVTEPNQAPTDIALSNSSVAENQPTGTSVGTLSATDPDASDTHTFSLVSGVGDTDNASFQIDGLTLETNSVFDFETKSSYSVRIRVEDSASNTFEEAFTITITDANDAPTDIALSNASVNENEAAGTTVGELSATDLDVGDTHTFTLVAGAGDTDNASFQIDGTTFETNAVFNFEVKNSYTIRVRVSDSGSGTFEEQFTITIVDVNDAPTAVADSYGNAVGNTLAVLGTSGSGPHIVLTGNVITSNDTDEDTSFPNTISAVAETVASTGGGSATIAADGSFTFLPGVGDKNQVDTFTYHITDGALQSTGTVSVTIANVLVWYVNASAGAGDGRSTSPLNTLLGINGAGGSGDSDTTGDIVFLYSGTYGGGLPLEASQRLIGQPHGLTVNPGSGNVTLVAAGGTNPVIGNSGGAGIGLANGVEVQRVNVNGTSGAGVTGSAVTTATIGSNTSIGGATGNAFELSGAANGTIDVGATISSSTARSVSVQNRSGGSVNLTGNITDTGLGILLNSNTGATINLTGSLTISTGTNAGFTATGGGIVNASTASNTIATTTGTALSVTNTTIGASGLTFTSISANGAANGIVLNNTGSSGGLTVTGDGTNTSVGGNASGGTISNISGADGATAGRGVYLNNTQNISLRRMTINGTNQNFGIYGSNVNGMTLEYSTVGGTNGTSVAADEGSIVFDGLVGTSSFISNALSGGIEDNFRIRNSGGTANVTISGSTFTNAPNDNLIIEPSGTATVTAHVTNNTFTGAGGDHFQTSTTNSATLNVVFTGNLYSGGFAGSLLQGITISGGNLGSSEHVNFDISNNGTSGTPLVGNVQGGAINVNQGQGGGTWQGRVQNNFIGNALFVGSGSAQSSGIRVENHSTSGTMTAIINANTIRQWNNGAAINTQAGDAGNASNTGVLNVTVTNNTATNPGASSQHGFVANIGAGSGSGTAANVACVDVRSNTLDGNVVNGGAGVRVRHREVSTVRIPGYTGTQYDTTAVATYLQSLNPASIGPATAGSSGTGPGYANTSPAGSACAQPTIPS